MAEGHPVSGTGGDFITAVASVGIPVQGRIAVQETSGNSAVGETAFAMAVDEATVQGGLKEIADVLAEGEPEEGEKKKPEKVPDLSGIPAILLQGAYHLQQVMDAEAPDEKTLPYKSRRMTEAALPGNGLAGVAVSEEAVNQADVPGWPAAFQTENNPGLLEAAKAKAATDKAEIADVGNPAPESILGTAKGMDELDQTSFRNIQKLQVKSTPSAAQPLGIDTAPEVVKPSTAATAADAHVSSEPLNDVKAGKEKEKPFKIPALAMEAAYRTEQAIHTESMQSTPEMAPENTSREDNVAMQLARSSVRALKRGMAEYRVRLSPEGLGEVEVTVITKGKAVSLSLRTDNEVARGLILDHADELRAELDKQNYQVNGLSVEVGMDSGNGAGFFASREHTAPVFEPDHMASRQEAALLPAANGQQADPRMIMPRSSTINYRV